MGAIYANVYMHAHEKRLFARIYEISGVNSELMARIRAAFRLKNFRFDPGGLVLVVTVITIME